MKTRQKIGYAIFFGMMTLGLLACGGIVPSGETTAVSLSIQTPSSRSKLQRFSASVPSSISSVTIAVSGDNIDSKSETLPVIAGETLQWTDQIQNGLNRLFTVTAKGGAEEELCSGSEAVDLLGQAVTLNIVLKGCPFTLRLSLSGNGEGAVTSEPQGIACGSDCEATYPFNTGVALIATPAVGSSFAGFNGDDPRCGRADIIMDTDLRCIAVFDLISRPSQLLKITLEGRGLGTVVSSPVGIDCGFDCTAPFDRGSTVVLSATANAGSRFVSFSGDFSCTALSHLSLVMSANLNCTATFEAIPPSPKLSILLQGTGLGRVTSSPVGIDCGITCMEIFAQGRRVMLTATPESGSRFVAFSGGCTGLSPLFLRIDGDLTCIASFKAISPSPTLTILLQGTGGGTVTSSPGGINCGADCTEMIAQGRRVTLTATPAAGSIFARFTGPPGCVDPSFVMEGDRTCTAIFERAIIAP